MNYDDYLVSCETRVDNIPVTAQKVTDPDKDEGLLVTDLVLALGDPDHGEHIRTRALAQQLTDLTQATHIITLI